MPRVEHTPKASDPPASKGPRASFNEEQRGQQGGNRGTHENTQSARTGLPHPHSRLLDDGEQLQELVIKISPASWGIQDWNQQTVENCKLPFLNHFLQLHFQNVEKEYFSWFEDEDLQQYFAMNVIRTGKKGNLIPAALTDHEIDDFYSYTNGEIHGITISLSPKNLLSGILAANPREMFNSLERITVFLQNYPISGTCIN